MAPKSEIMWNLWHGCHKISEGCRHCYVYRRDSKVNRDPSQVFKTQKFDLPVKKKKNGEYKQPSDTFFWTCFTSDFLLKDADKWREDAWNMIRERRDCHFLFITKRIERLENALPEDWGDGYDNVTVCCTMENQKMVDIRLPVFMNLPIKHKKIISEPLLGEINFTPYFKTFTENSSQSLKYNSENEIVKSTIIEEVVVGGESGHYARPCDYDWILKIRDACINANIPFTFKQTGANFIKNGKHYRVARRIQHSQAKKALINWP